MMVKVMAENEPENIRSGCSAIGDPGILPISIMLASLYWLISHLCWLSFNRVGVLPMPVWPASGLEFVAGLLFSWKAVPGLAIGSFLANYFSLSGDFVHVLIVSLGNSIGPVFAANLLRQQTGLKPLDSWSHKDFSLLFVTSVLVAPFITSLTGIGSKKILGLVTMADVPYEFLKWWLANGFGILFLAPLLLLIVDRLTEKERYYCETSNFVLRATVFVTAWLWMMSSLLDYVWFNKSEQSLLVSFFPVLDPQQLINRLLFAGFILMGILLVSRLVSNLSGLEGKNKSFAEKLQKSEERFRLAMDATSDGLWDWDVPTDEGYYSPCYYTMLGYEPGEFAMKGEVWVSFLHPEDREKTLLLNLECIDNLRESFEVEYRMKTKDGSWKWILGRGKAASRDSNGRATRLIGTHQDINERKKAEVEQQRLHEQLAQSQKMESVGRLAGGIAHDFNNMLGVIQGYAELALQNPEKADQVVTYLHEIHKTAIKSADLTRQLLAFARKQSAEPRLIDLNSKVSGTLKLVSRLLGEHINLVWQPDGSICPIRIDPVQIDQILTNLCINAGDAISGTGNVRIETHNIILDEQACNADPEFTPGAFVQLIVADDGCGFDHCIKEHIFEPFFTTKEAGKGTGLGLATVYGIVKQNNGFIEASSEPGKGSSFCIYFPRIEGEVDCLVPEESIKSVTEGKKYTVLLVEDDFSILKMTRVMLEHLGYNVLATGCAEEAVTIVERDPQKIDLLLTDVIMPKMNGKELYDRVRNICPAIKCLFMSGYTANIIARQGIVEDELNFLQKPFKVKTLSEKVQQVLGIIENKAPEVSVG